MRFTTVKRMLRNSGLSYKGIDSVFQYMLGTPDNEYHKANVKRRWLIAVKRAFAIEAREKEPLSHSQIQFILNQKQVQNEK
jgi:hypothetical protein